ncbi:synapsin-1-like [Pezoporus occidentalis]|uniref:synapsin-1-like n=1 Tax=Pezoporus occidentalis TaxID=407982 RepID=UPI002F91332E
MEVKILVKGTSTNPTKSQPDVSLIQPGAAPGRGSGACRPLNAGFRGETPRRRRRALLAAASPGRSSGSEAAHTGLARLDRAQAAPAFQRPRGRARHGPGPLPSHRRPASAPRTLPASRTRSARLGSPAGLAAPPQQPRAAEPLLCQRPPSPDHPEARPWRKGPGSPPPRRAVGPRSACQGLPCGAVPWKRGRGGWALRGVPRVAARLPGKVRSELPGCPPWPRAPRPDSPGPL